ncbi:pmp22 family protein [Cavenderia fasciculata]|uniref:Pmp22 family protein n=1 Tax=Cavenderia fasciculata TaxID=261658 RepID=F4QEC8_CACFS|nr:pmp22 family protein [Cavenderia fasciculata]EGG14075.1 pmp22 family protein [Cavenderia fasciculata]|eukprot:XP_004350783.1 pmp22 family protein [Cavenderia fasciculata]
MSSTNRLFTRLFPRLSKFGQRAYSGYVDALHTKPILTKAVTTGTLYFISDTISQHLENRKKASDEWKFDYVRAFKFSVFGFVITGPTFHFWYHILDTSFPKKVFSHVIIKAALDQIICAPIFDAVFFMGMGVLDGKSKEDIYTKLKNDWLRTYLVDCAVWPICNIVSFRYISNKQRVLFMNIVNIGWAAFLASINAGH